MYLSFDFAGKDHAYVKPAQENMPNSTDDDSALEDLADAVDMPISGKYHLLICFYVLNVQQDPHQSRL